MTGFSCGLNLTGGLFIGCTALMDKIFELLVLQMARGEASGILKGLSWLRHRCLGLALVWWELLLCHEVLTCDVIDHARQQESDVQPIFIKDHFSLCHHLLHTWYEWTIGRQSIRTIADFGILFQTAL